MKRDGRKLKDLKAGDKRRLYDGRNAYRKMTAEQREEFRAFIKDFDKNGDPKEQK